jgi:hypothetical protein
VSFNGRGGVVTLTANDISAAGGAALASPAFTGVPTAPTAATGVNSTQIATTAYVVAALGSIGGPFLALSGGTMTGALALAGPPTAASQAATKAYVDTSLGAAETQMASLNVIRNAGMDIWQRGAGFSVAASTTPYTADGWMVNPGTVGVTVTRGVGYGTTAFALVFTAQPGGASLNLFQRVESILATRLAGRICTFQATINNQTSAPITPTLQTAFPTVTNNFASVTTDLAPVNLQTIPAGGTAIVAYTFTASASANLGYAPYLGFGAALASGGSIGVTAVDLRVTPGVALGLNAAPPAAEVPNPVAALANAQRYYVLGVGGLPIYGYGTAGVAIGANWTAPVIMMRIPTVVFSWSSPSNTSGATVTAMGDARTIFATFQVAATGGASAALNITSLSAEL